ncbi:MAG: HD-GYP domain-containing protein [Gammaproteobacteria bacterium]|nr:HD-GYP domain-containing protein [Gammaproteobacteria bacterium]
MTKKIRISASRLQIGMSVIELDRPWIETPFLLQGFTIGNRSDIKAIQEYCQFVFIDTDSMPVPAKSNIKRKKHVDKPGFFNNLYKKRAEVVSTSVEKEISTAHTIHQKTSTLVKNSMNDILLGNAVNEQAIKESIIDTVESVVRNPDAMMWLSRLSNKDDRSSQHSVNCCILGVTFGRFIGLPKEELEKLAISALMHDIGKLQIPTEILNKPGSLTADEMKIVRQHPTYSRNLIMSAGKYFSPAVDVSYSHHERMDGTGYPRKLTDSQISPFARILAIIDTYEAMTSEQVYREELSPFETLKHLNAKKNSQFDEQLVKLFIRLIGVFPVGSIVELTTGQIGIVITSNREDNLRPKILVMLDHNKIALERSILNLAENNVDALGRTVKIARTLRKGDYGIDQEQLRAEGIEFTVLN